MTDLPPAELITRRRTVASAAAVGQRALQAWSDLSGVLSRLLPMARRVATGVRLVAWSSFVAAALIVVAFLVIDVPTTPVPVLGLLIIAGLLATPGVILLLFHGALREVLLLPDWLRQSPDLVKEHGTELSKLVTAARSEGEGRRRSLPRESWTAGKLLLRTHSDLPGYGEMLRLISPPFLIATVIAFAAVAFEWVFVPVMLLTALVVRLIA